VKELRIYYSASHALTFYEVVSGTFVQSDSLYHATQGYQNTSGKTGHDLGFLKERFPDLKLSQPNPRELRVFRGEGSPFSFELIPGHVVFASSRESAEQMYKSHCGKPGNDPGAFGTWIDGSFLHSHRVFGSDFVSDYNKYGITLEAAEELREEQSRGVVIWSGPYGQPYWELAPGKVIKAGTLEQAREWYRSSSAYRLRKVEDIPETIIKTDFTGPVPPPSSISPGWVRRFMDKDADLTWLLVNEDGEEVLSYGESLDEAREELEEDVEDRPADVLRHYGPLVELFESGGVSEPFSTWPPPWSFNQAVPPTQDEEEPTNVEGKNEMEMPMKLNPDGTINTSGGGSSYGEDERNGQRRPMALETLKDQKGRTWYGLPSGNWVCDVELSDRSATGAWNLWRDSGFDRYLGCEADDMRRNFGPMTSPSLEVLDDDKSIDFGGTFDTERRCRCSNRGTLSDEHEDAKRLRVGDYTHCIDCGKLRP
jgi:hypothetical protein